MAIALDVLEAEVLGLSVLQRSHLLDRLITSLDADPEIQQAWAIEAERRDADIDAGKVEPVFVETVAQMPEAIRRAARDGDVVVTMGAGSVGNVALQLAAGDT